jgi:hypothetical protein
MKLLSLRWALLLLGGAVLLAHAGSPPAPAADFGRWNVVVLQSDDWGFEGWFPDRDAAETLADLVADVPARLRPYRTSSLESAVEVESLAAFLAGFDDADGLPLVLQANSVVAGIDLGVARPERISLHRPGRGEGAYFRPGLESAVDAAIAAGLWRPEVHGLTHFDLEALGRAWAEKDPVAERARAAGVVAYDGWRHDSELGAHEPRRAQDLARRTIESFQSRFGRPPVSFIAPDYRWGSDDESAWEALGIQVVQAKREQIEPRLHPGTLWGRIAKVVARAWDRRTRGFVYLDRPARLEPYGDADPQAPQGAAAAAKAVQREWAHGRPGIVSIHRVQLVNLDADVTRAGRDQLREMVRILTEQGDVRFLVDAEIAQLWRTGVSILDRGPWRIVRNYSGRDRVLEVFEGESVRLVPEGTHVFSRGSSSSESFQAVVPARGRRSRG